MSDPIIRINPSKPTDLDFEVSVQTSCADDKPCVRFSIELEEEKQWLSLVCVKDDETKKWNVTIPALKPLSDRATYPFILEVILEDYYFVPAKGELHPVKSPKANVGEKKPKVSASFDKEKDEDEKLEEGAPGFGGYAAGGYGQPINTKLLKPEMPPKTVHKEEPEEEDKEIEDVIHAKVTPGDQGMTADTRKQPDGKGKFNARQVAQKIVQDRLKVKKTGGKGFLFKRVGEKAVVDGLESEDIKRVLEERSEKVKKILKDD